LEDKILKIEQCGINKTWGAHVNFVVNICIWNRVTRWKSSPCGHSDIQTVTFPDFERQTVYCQTAWSWNWL